MPDERRHALRVPVAPAALLANLINNLPAVLAVLLGVNIGPNLGYAGSLATLLWRRIAQGHGHGHAVELREFTRLGLLTMPVTLTAATPALWASLAVFL